MSGGQSVQVVHFTSAFYSHHFSAMETAPAGRVLVAVDLASMGPPLFSDGNVDNMLSCYFSGVLQWGHHFSAMETLLTAGMGGPG